MDQSHSYAPGLPSTTVVQHTITVHADLLSNHALCRHTDDVTPLLSNHAH
jgi:hypothetical protein